MKYMLLIYGDEEKMRAIPKEDANKMMPAYAAYTEALKKAGVILGGERLQFSSTATTVRIRDGKSKVLNGPYAEAKEQLGGFYMIDVPDLDAALSWASRCPGASHGTIEVRPVWAMQ
ncbi:MAG TPA: YciI family protein [Dongiaceae bacterium]|nr:YciI family protein [Dongiaceae bacterium]HSE72977.1 YciI family protein [Dongiaceae bacterium]